MMMPKYRKYAIGVGIIAILLIIISFLTWLLYKNNQNNKYSLALFYIYEILLIVGLVAAYFNGFGKEGLTSQKNLPFIILLAASLASIVFWSIALHKSMSLHPNSSSIPILLIPKLAAATPPNSSPPGKESNNPFLRFNE